MIIGSKTISALLLSWILSGTPVSLQAQVAHTITITSGQIENLKLQREEILGRPLDHEELEALVQYQVQEEVMVREAIKLGLHQTDQEIRNRLMVLMRFLLEDPPLKPEESDLKAFFETHKEDYMLAGRISFEQVFFESDPPGWTVHEVETRLANGEQIGTEHWMGKRIEDKTANELKFLLGAAFTRKIFKSKVGEWIGPYPSLLGTHYVKINAKLPPEHRSYEKVATFVRKDWKRSQEQQRMNEKIQELARAYRINLPEGFNK